MIILAGLAVLGCEAAPSPVGRSRAALTLSTERTLTPVETPSSYLGATERPISVVGGGVRLVVHRDFKEWGLFVQRFDATDGKPLDASRVLITRSSDYQPSRSPSVYVSALYDGKNFVVVWESWYDQICLLRIKPDGTVVDANPIRVSDRQAVIGNPTIATDGTYYLVAWGDATHSSSEGNGSIIPVDITGARVRVSDGVVLNRISICQSPGIQSEPTAAFDGTNFLVAWQHKDTVIRGNRIRPSDGAVLDGAGVLLNGATNVGQTGPRLAFDGTNYVLVWRQNDELRLGRFSPALQWIDGAGVVLDSGKVMGWAAIAADGKRSLVSWYRAMGTTYELVSARIDTSGATITPGVPAQVVPSMTIPWNPPFDPTIFMSAQRPDVIYDGTRFLVTWLPFRELVDEDKDGYLVLEVQVTSVDAASGAAGTSQPGALTERLQEWASASFDGRHHLVVWQERREGYVAQLRGARIEDGTGVIGDSFLVAKGTTNYLYPAVAYGNGQHLVVWWDISQERLLAARVRADDGAVVDATPLVLPATPTKSLNELSMPPFDVTSDGKDFLVVWVRDTSAYALRVRGADGAVSLPAFQVATAATRLRHPKVVYTGGGYVMSWAEGHPMWNNETKRMVSTRISQDGSVSNPAGETVADINDWVIYTAMAAGPDGALVAWGGGYPYGIWTRRLGAADAKPIDAAKLQAGAKYGLGRIAASFDGKRYLLAWTTNPTPYQYDLQGVQLGADGKLDGSEFAISAAPGAVSDLDPTLSVAGPDRVLVLYSRLTPAPGYSSRRAFVRWLGEGPPVDAGTPVSADATPPADLAPPPPDAFATADAGPPPPDAGAPPPDVGAPPPDAPAAPDTSAEPADGPPLTDAAGMDLAPPDDGASPGVADASAGDAAGGTTSADAAAPPDVIASGDAAVPADLASGADAGTSGDVGLTDASSAPSTDAGADRSTDGGPGNGGTDCDCDLGGPARAKGSALIWTVALLPLLVRRRRRTARARRG